MNETNYTISELKDMDKVIIFLEKDCTYSCHTKKMVFRKEEIREFRTNEIYKIDGYISRFKNDLQEDFIVINIPDMWFWDNKQKKIEREEDFDLSFIPKQAIKSIKPALETVLKKFVTEQKHRI